tara:strand:+ start:3194 stop:4108 length:915 start_codon:yes stop_codon:yes gene_type:complete
MKLEEMFYITEKDWYRLQAWATLAYEEDKNEISGLMTAVPQEDGRIKVGDVEILKQENTGSNTELDGDAVSEYMMKYGMKYNNPEMKFVWWHSHHTMGAFWSGTDIKEIEAWENNSYSLALVINLKEEYLFRVSFWKTNGLPIEQHIDTTLTIERKQPNIHILDSMKKQYKELCSSPVVHTLGARRAGISWNSHGQMFQNNLWQQNEKDIEIENAYVSTLEELESLIESFVSGTESLKKYKKSIKAINKECKKHKMPFSVKDIKGSKHDVCNILMTKMPYELIEWDSNNNKELYENDNWIGGWH